jgi:hypothetical protein
MDCSSPQLRCMLLMREAFAPLVLVSLSAVFSLIDIALTSTVLS